MQSSKITKKDNIANVVLLEKCLRLPGKANIEVELKKGTEIVSSFYIPAIIEKSSKENITSDDVPNFIEIFENAATEEEKRIANEAARQSAEETRNTAEAERVTNENNRSNAETNRAEAETERVDSETSRNTSETNREEAETARITAENARNVAEQARAEAEAARVAAEEKRQQSMSKLIVEDIRSKNMFNKNAVVAGILNGDGTIEAMEGLYTSDFIKVEPGHTYYTGQSDSARFKFYDENKTALSSTYADLTNAGNPQAFTVPNNAHYIRFSVTQNYLSTLQVEEGTQATAYCKHFDFNTIEEVIENENGTAVKYSNGIMKCYHKIIGNQFDCTSHIEGRYYFTDVNNSSENSKQWTFPVAFIEPPVVNLSVSSSAYSYNSIGWANNTTAIGYCVLPYAVTGTQFTWNFTARGRWK